MVYNMFSPFFNTILSQSQGLSFVLWKQIDFPEVVIGYILRKMIFIFKARGLKVNISKYGKLLYFQNVVILCLTQAYHAIPAL